MFQRDPDTAHNPTTPWGFCITNYAEDSRDWQLCVGYCLPRSHVDKQICQEILMALNDPIHIYLDNTGAVASENPVFHNMTFTGTLSET